MGIRWQLACLLLVALAGAAYAAGPGHNDGRGDGHNGHCDGGKKEGGKWSKSCKHRIRNPRDKPNFVLFFADDMGYGDLASYGHPTQERGAIDDIMVKGGIRFTQGYVPDSLCTPSRTALITGRYPARSGVYSAPGGPRVFLPETRSGLPSSELTMAEALKTAGYTTGMAGKWHLGINSKTRDDGTHLPMNHGFDFVGHFLPFTNSFACDDTGRLMDFPDVEKCFLFKNKNTIVAQPFNHTYLSQTFVNDALSFIADNVDNPFFFYFPLAHPHVSLFASPPFVGSSKRGEYGDNINEMNDAVGQVLHALEEHGLAENTLTLFISDHGPQPEYCAHGGDAGILKGYKSNTWEGGIRIPFIAYWPGTIKPRESDTLVSSLDILRTLMDLGGGSLPSDRQYDGEIITDVLLNDAPSPHDALFYYCEDRLMAVRSGPYKIHFYTHRVQTKATFATQCSADGLPSRHYTDCDQCYGSCVSAHNPPLVYNIENDPKETYALDPNSDLVQQVLADLQDEIKNHRDSMIPADPILQDQDPDGANLPCCNPDTGCICNYGPVDGPYN
ncbi:arylsulfatase-like [Diadema antillarum]|uniref:arylsulfatase-like n=1 Tax=Diadema antillarum TaxID=105358 RepID=UPI003A8C47BD